MHPLFEKASGLTETIIAAAIEVHRDKGPGLIEFIYEWRLLKELGLSGLGCVSQGLHARRASTLRFARGGLRSCANKSVGENPADPQGATLELHEIAERPHRIANQFP
jgi:hypothetical protein